jgi:hypothetical protein
MFQTLHRDQLYSNLPGDNWQQGKVNSSGIERVLLQERPFDFAQHRLQPRIARKFVCWVAANAAPAGSLFAHPFTPGSTLSVPRGREW